MLAAVASYVRARAFGGQWLVRIEDIDPPREQAGAADDILRQLEAAGLHWDGAVLRQSSRLLLYREVAQSLVADGLAYRCSCSRKDIAAHPDSGPAGTRYPGTCRHQAARAHGPHALRAIAPDAPVCFEDVLQGIQCIDVQATTGDFIIWRKESLPAYHLAVVVDDHEQAITEVVRGMDLLEATGPHLHLQRSLGLASPRYLHIPVLVDAASQKLSKQTGAKALAPRDMPAALTQCLQWLGWTVPRELQDAPPAELLAQVSGSVDFAALRGLGSVAAG
jgi:glutamyl-Q tRNA(Asp) synthetase